MEKKWVFEKKVGAGRYDVHERQYPTPAPGYPLDTFLRGAA